MQRPTSDHVPIKLDPGEAKEKRERIFRFEKWCLEHVGIYEIIRQSWAQWMYKVDATDNICT